MAAQKIILVKQEATLLAWHYTTGGHFESIVSSWSLRPTAIAVEPPEKPVLWFSLEQYWEQAACKGWEERGRVRLMTMAETYEKGRGLARFGISRDRLTPWPRLQAVARIPPRIAQGLVRRAEELGANPRQWLGTVGALSIDQIEAIDIMENSTWVRIRPKPVSSP